MPQIDEREDWYLIDSQQNSTHTSLQFTRPLITCDDMNDRDITRDTIRIIYAFSDSDPKSISDIPMHKSKERGSKSVLLLSQPDSNHNKPQETGLKSFVLNVKNVRKL